MTENPLFPTGQVLCTPKAWGEIKRYKADIPTFLKRHVLGDWDNMNGEDNNFSIERGYEICSSYVLSTDTFDGCVFNNRVWIVTEENRSTTMILLPEEYDSMYS
jgi:hypothetical protein